MKTNLMWGNLIHFFNVLINSTFKIQVQKINFWIIFFATHYFAIFFLFFLLKIKVFVKEFFFQIFQRFLCII